MRVTSPLQDRAESPCKLWPLMLLLSGLVVRLGLREAPHQCLSLRGEEERVRPPEAAAQRKVVPEHAPNHHIADAIVYYATVVRFLGGTF